MPDEAADRGRRRGLVWIVLGVLVLGLLVGGGAALLIDDSGSGSSASSTSSSTSSTTTAEPGPAPTTAVSGPACSAAAISQAVQANGDQVASVDDFKCGNGWAGASYSTPDFSVATLLKAQGAQWVVVDRAQYCDDPSIPSDVHFYCTVS